MDWGLLDRHSKENLLLREELVYRFRAYYYGAIVEDVIIRFAWILPLALRNFPQLLDTEVVTSVVMFAEVTSTIDQLVGNPDRLVQAVAGYVRVDPTEAPTVMRTKFPATVMVFDVVVVSSEGHIMTPQFFSQGLRVDADADAYVETL
ncbi:hypothetical protein ACTXT7_001461 [Hymenolepis weldensis]